ncbi:enoyl-CoA hydratase/isomerase family protein (plasmid) [Chromobacterium amazonense]|uniref:enoyl-CoA hydratase/isomerase family protein n=1 Tax=Chromobacterium amazonense TaxID=1382803 RepID=UPI00237DB7DC|nr:enoyl-CoA hydratase/isomerase family protein [Chromobacterium amazonense]MDE1712113.1 enoyl-CoA hydratase/isomerase family protein [Chromobacterium amazonense]
MLRGAGERAFCAGGDVRSLRDKLISEPHYPNPHAVAFFTEEYTLDYRIHRYPKPLIVWGGGIVMGGGLGLMAGASHRVATPATRIAMPEITIGLYPDVGGSWFLQRMPAHLGLFLALTGAPLNAHDALIANLADGRGRGQAIAVVRRRVQAAGAGRPHPAAGLEFDQGARGLHQTIRHLRSGRRHPRLPGKARAELEERLSSKHMATNPTKTAKAASRAPGSTAAVRRLPAVFCG